MQDLGLKALEQRLVEMLLDEKRREWREENREAIEAYNRRIEADGMFSDGLRKFLRHIFYSPASEH
jgi:antitoxin CcdA